MAEVVVTTDQGKIQGKVEKNYLGGKFYSFYGIPYAKAPVGNLRFKAPEPPEPWEGILEATKNGPPCPQLSPGFNMLMGKEDNCLNLNIYTREFHNENSKLQPVMVFIHGGGFNSGSNESTVYGPKYLMTADVVLVVINYRIGVLGFLSLEDPSLNVPGNSGLKDQVMALHWIQKNIQKFGGDQNNVTVFGISAGGASVHYLLLSPLTKGLFHKAIMQSGSAFNPWARGKLNALEIASGLGYTEKDEKTIYEKLIKENIKNIANAVHRFPHTYFAAACHPYGPVIEREHDEAFLCKDPEEIMKSGNYNKIPIIIGYNSMEGLLFDFLRKISSKVTLPLDLTCDIPYNLNVHNSETKIEIAGKIKKLYYGNGDISEENIIPRYLITGDTVFVNGIIKSIQLMSQHQPVYVYRNSLDSSLNFFKKMCRTKWLKTMITLTLLGNFISFKMFNRLADKFVSDIPGASHGDDIFYLFSFGAHNLTEGSEEDILVQKFVKLWTNFAKHGDPTAQEVESFNNVIWKPTFNEKINIFQIDKTVQLLSRYEEEDRFNFWEDITKIYGQLRS